MPRNKDLKRLVRARMSKTGESYTAARARVLARSAAERKTASAAATRAASAPPAPKVDYARLAGMADATIKAKIARSPDRDPGPGPLFE